MATDFNLVHYYKPEFRFVGTELIFKDKTRKTLDSFKFNDKDLEYEDWSFLTLVLKPGQQKSIVSSPFKSFMIQNNTTTIDLTTILFNNIELKFTDYFYYTTDEITHLELINNGTLEIEQTYKILLLS